MNRKSSASEQLPAPSNGSWLELELEQEASKAVWRALEREAPQAERSPEICEALEVSEWRWPALELWRVVFRERGECPGMWEEVLVAEPPTSAMSAVERELWGGLSADGRQLARSVLGAFSVEGVRKRLGWSEAKAVQAIELLEAEGVPVVAASTGAVLEAMSIQELRSVQRRLELKGARSKKELAAIIENGADDAAIRGSFEREYFVLEGLSSLDEQWSYYCSWVARLLVHTFDSERHVAERLADARETGVVRLEWSATGDGLDSVCEQRCGQTFALGDTERGRAHFPGCRCTLLVAEREEPDFESALEAAVGEGLDERSTVRQRPRSRASNGGCLILLPSLFGMATMLSWLSA